MRPFILLATLVASAVLATPALANAADVNEPVAVPRSHQIKAQHRRSALEAAAELASRASKYTGKKGARLTYYWGRQLQAPACGGPTPNDDDMIAAIVDPKKGGGYAKCGDRITLSHKGRQITVKGEWLLHSPFIACTRSRPMLLSSQSSTTVPAVPYPAST